MLESKSFVSSGNKVSLILLFAQNIHKLNLIVCSQSERKSESEWERERVWNYWGYPFVQWHLNNVDYMCVCVCVCEAKRWQVFPFVFQHTEPHYATPLHAILLKRLCSKASCRPLVSLVSVILPNVRCALRCGYFCPQIRINTTNIYAN